MKADLEAEHLLKFDDIGFDGADDDTTHPLTGHDLLLHRGFFGAVPVLIDLGMRHVFEGHQLNFCDPEHVKRVIVTGHSRGGAQANTGAMLLLMQYQRLFEEAIRRDPTEDVPIEQLHDPVDRRIIFLGGEVATVSHASMAWPFLAFGVKGQRSKAMNWLLH